jgi:hypothetical protein
VCLRGGFRLTTATATACDDACDACDACDGCISRKGRSGTRTRDRRQWTVPSEQPTVDL